MKCKYFCEIQSKGKKLQEERKEETKESQLNNMTYCHDKSEWESLLNRTECLCDLKKLEEGSVKRKLYQGKCEECLKNQKFLFTSNHKDISKLVNFMLRASKRKILKNSNNNNNTNKQKVKNKKAVKAETKREGLLSKENLNTQRHSKSNIMQTAVVSSTNIASTSTKGSQIVTSSKSVLELTKTSTSSTVKPISNSSITIQGKPKIPKMNTNILSSDRSLLITNVQPTSHGHQPIANRSLTIIPKKHASPRKCMNSSSNKPFNIIDLTPVSTQKQVQAAINNSQVTYAKNLQFTSKTDNQTPKHQSILPKLTPLTQTPAVLYPSNVLKPINVPMTSHVSSMDLTNNHFKKELLLVQVREYLRKNPDAVNYSPPQLNEAPFVYLSKKLPTQHNPAPLAFRAMLPEHLWKDLISAGIAQHEIENIVLDSNAAKQKMLRTICNQTPATDVQSLVSAFQNTINESQVTHFPNYKSSATINSLNSSIQALQKIKTNIFLNSCPNLNFQQEQKLQITQVSKQNNVVIESPPTNSVVMTQKPHEVVAFGPFSQHMGANPNILVSASNQLVVGTNHQNPVLIGTNPQGYAISGPHNHVMGIKPQNQVVTVPKHVFVETKLQNIMHHSSSSIPHTSINMQPLPNVTRPKHISMGTKVQNQIVTVPKHVVMETKLQNQIVTAPKHVMETKPHNQIVTAPKHIMGGISHSLYSHHSSNIMHHPSSSIPHTSINMNPLPNVVKLQSDHYVKTIYNQLVNPSLLSSRISTTSSGCHNNQQLTKGMFTTTSLSNSSSYKTNSINPPTTTAVSPSPKKKTKRIKLPSHSECEQYPQKQVHSTASVLKHVDPSKTVHSSTVNKISRKASRQNVSRSVKDKVQEVLESCLDIEVDLNSISGNEFIERHLDMIDDNDCFMDERRNKHGGGKRRNYLQMLNEFLVEQEKKTEQDEETDLRFVISNEDGLRLESSSLQGFYN